MMSDNSPVSAVRTAAEPVTAEEVAALARRIRVEAKLTRIAAVGTVLGLVCGAAAVLPFLDTGGFMAESIAANDLYPVGFLAGWLLAGFLPLLAFYAGRLQFQSGQSSTGALETGLRKLRRVILGSMFASMTAFVVVLAQRQSERYASDGAAWVAFTYAACFTACAFIVGDVRRGLGDFDTEQQRRRRKLARGFAVELRPAQLGPVGAPASEDGIPLAALAGAAVLPSATTGDRLASAGVSGFGAPPPPPSIPTPRPALPAGPATLVDPGDDEHAKDLRLLVTLGITLALAVHALRLGSDLTSVLRRAERFPSSVLELGASWSGNAPGADFLNASLLMLAATATLLLVPCAVLWLVWGILSLNYGPMLRRAAGWLTVVTLASGVLCGLPGGVYGLVQATYGRDDIEFGMFARAPEIVHALFLGLLLTRPGVRRLFARSSRTDDAD